MLFVYEEAGDGAGTGVKVLVCAPGCEVDVPIVQFQIDVADGVGTVPTNRNAVGVCMGGDAGDVEVLAGVELDSWEENEGCGCGMGGDQVEDRRC